MMRCFQCYWLICNLEPDFIFALRIASAEQLPGGPASSPSSTSQHGPAHLPGAPLTAALGTGENPVPYEQVPPDTQPLGNRGGALLASHKQVLTEAPPLTPFTCRLTAVVSL